ncbi:MAG: polysaccharide deacetylase family protein [Clostridia bacterium]|nr:polysaccharide deacetylase family protein [Clostridia bacterium]
MKKILIVLLTLTFLSNMIAPLAIRAQATPEISVFEHTVSVTEVDSIKYIRYAKGIYYDANSIKNAEGSVTLNQRSVLADSDNGVFSVTLTESGFYTFWIKTNDSLEYIETVELKPLALEVNSDGLTITVYNLEEVRDFLIAKGTYDNYSDSRNNKVASISSSRIEGKSEYSYMVSEQGDYTVAVRYKDSAKEHSYFHISISVPTPSYENNGLQVKVGNLTGVKVIRTAYGEYDSVGDIKRAQGSRAFSAKNILKGLTEYTIQYRDNGRVTIGVVYNNGYEELYKYEVAKRVPVVTKEDQTITFSNLEHLQNIRYAKGVYTNSADIKNAQGSVTVKKTDVVNNTFSVTLEYGTYSFCVQYDDESYNYYTFEIAPLAPTAYGIHVSNAFSDNMVLQRDEPLSVWGTALSPAGTTVLCEVNGEKAVGVVDENGNWKATFAKTFPYSTQGTLLTASCAEGVLYFHDVLFGDVYYVIGQSNVFYSIGQLLIDLDLNKISHQLSIDYSDSRNMRFFRVSSSDYLSWTGNYAQGTTAEFIDVFNGEYWKKPSDIGKQVETYANFTPATPQYDRDAIDREVFSALGYVFAFNMTSRSDVPVGVIEIDASGHPLMTFAPNELADKWGDDVVDEATGIHHYNLNGADAPQWKTRFAYNQQIHPLKNFSIAGVIWYQGESDYANTREAQGIYADTFATQFAELMTYFRNNFGNSDFPVYMIEFATTFYNEGKNAYMDFDAVKTELGTIPQILDDCYIVSSSDFWHHHTWQNNIHPYIKHLQAFRLTDIVLSRQNNCENMEYVHGPVLREVVYESNTRAKVYFDNVGDGLRTSDSTGYLRGVEICVHTGEGYAWLPHEGYIITGKDNFTLDAGSFTLFGVRYNRQAETIFSKQINLCSSIGMPAIAFVDYNTEKMSEMLPKKYFTLSFDDGTTQDTRIIEILEKYGIDCCSFNINTGLMGVNWSWVGESIGKPWLSHLRFTEEEIRSGIYDGYDVLVHTKTHPTLKDHDNDVERIVEEVEGCAEDIEDLTGTKPVGMAWPGGDDCRTPQTVKTVFENTSIRFARAYSPTYTYNLPNYFLDWHPSCHIFAPGLMEMARQFVEMTPTRDSLFYVWGHGYELDQEDFYDEFEAFIKYMSEAEGVEFVTNTEFYEIYKDQIPSCIYQ